MPTTMPCLLTRFSHLLVACICTLSCLPAQAAAAWNIQDLRLLPGGTFTIATALNDAGQVAGYGDLEPQFDALGERIDKPLAFIGGPNGGALKVLDSGPADGFLSDFRPAAINSRGQLTGSALQGSSFKLGFVSGPDGAHLNYVTGDFDRSGLTAGVDINRAGVVLYQSSQGLSTPRIIKPDGTIIDITAGSQEGFAQGINDAGQVAFNLLDNGSGRLNGYIWSEAAGPRAARADGGLAEVYDINNAGQVLASGDEGVFIIAADGLSLRRLDLPEGSMLDTSDGFAPKLNDAGQVAGNLRTADGNSFAFVSAANGGSLTNLEATADIASAGWSELRITAINNSGQLAGYGLIHGATHGFVLSPVPEPGSYALLLAGLGLLAGAGHRKKPVPH